MGTNKAPVSLASRRLDNIAARLDALETLALRLAEHHITNKRTAEDTQLRDLVNAIKVARGELVPAELTVIDGGKDEEA